MGKTIVCDGFKFLLRKSMLFVASSFWCYIARLLGFLFGMFLSSNSGEISGEIAPVSSEACEVSEEFNSGENAREEMSSDEISREIAPFSGEVFGNSEEFNSGENACEETSSDEISREIAPFSNEACGDSEEFNSRENVHEEMRSDEISGEIIAPVSSKYEFSSGTTVCSFMEEPEMMSFTVQEMFVIHHDVSTDDTSSPSYDLVIDPNLPEHSYCAELNIVEEAVVRQREPESCVIFEEQDVLGDVNLENKTLSEHEFSDEVQSSRNSSDDFWASIHKYDEFDSDTDTDSDQVLSDEERVDLDYDEDSPKSLDSIPLDQTNSFLGDFDTQNEPEMEPEPLSPIVHVEEHIPSDKFQDSDDEFDQKNSTLEDPKDDDDDHHEDVLLEQKELIRQMKREMRHLKVSGLPTILEESESPRVEDDLRPLNIEERVIGHKDRMDEIQSLYRMYLDKMRKLDILSQQTMYAIGLLQLKNKDELTSSNKKASVPVMKSLLAQNFWSSKLRKQEAGPLQKLIKDFQRDLELVYVGQLCLSWEALKWQHQKAQQLHCHDPDGFRQHNQVAGEFQKFQVLLQRFTEDEPFHHGPRVQHYVKTRCALPNLLQVPLIKDDPRAEWRGKGEGGISVGMLKEVIGASMQAFWEFLRADRDHEFHTVSLMGIHGHPVDLQDPLDAELLAEIRTNLQKKEKRLKDLVKSGNCIVKKLQKHRDHHLSHEMFLAQVELRLVSKVLNMSRLTTDQLLWCHKKISKVNIIGRKIYLESSVLLFPC